MKNKNSPLTLTLVLFSAFLAVACGKSVERETTEQPTPRNTTAPTLTIPQNNTTPIVQQLPQRPILRPTNPFPNSPNSPSELPSDGRRHRKQKVPAGLPSDWFSRPVVDAPTPDSDTGCGCHQFCDEIRIVTQSLEQMLKEQLSVEISTQESSLLELGYHRCEKPPVAKYEGEGCTSFTSKCEKGQCSKRSVCGRQFLVVSKFESDSLFAKNVGVRMIVSPDRPDAIVSQVLSQSDFASIDLKWTESFSSETTVSETSTETKTVIK